MNKFVKMALFAQIIYFACSTNFTQAQEQAALPPSVNGMLLVLLDGPYQYNSGGVPLAGYIRTFAWSISSNPKDNPTGKTPHQPTDKVKLHICKTGKEIIVNYGDLVPVEQGCLPSPGHTWPETTGSLPEWKINSGNLVVDQKANWSQIVKQSLTALSLKDIPISALPVGYQSGLLSERQGKTVAITVPAEDGSLLLGILPERKTGSGS